MKQKYTRKKNYLPMLLNIPLPLNMYKYIFVHVIKFHCNQFETNCSDLKKEKKIP